LLYIIKKNYISMKTSLLPILLFLINTNVLAQKSTEILPNSITLPRLSTTQQNSIPPQQAGNIIYNADEKKLALHDGTNWNYLTANAAASGFRNMKVFLYTSQTWTVPAGVTKIRVELWAGGQAGRLLNDVGATFVCFGGRGACYALYELNVTPNEDLDFVVGSGGLSSNGYNGSPSEVRRNGNVIAKAYLYTFDSTQYGEGLLNVVEGAFGEVSDFSFQQVEPGVFRKIVRTGAGGGTYPFFNNGGRSTTLEFTVPGGVLVGKSDAFSISGIAGGGSACYTGTVNTASSGRINLYY
jgi:hypothetical protein